MAHHKKTLKNWGETDTPFAECRAFQNFCCRENQSKKLVYPRCKSKRVVANIRHLDHAIQFLKLGNVTWRISEEARGRALSATVSQDSCGIYLVALCLRRKNIIKVKSAPVRAANPL